MRVGHTNPVLVHIIFYAIETAAGATGSLTNAVGSENLFERNQSQGIWGLSADKQPVLCDGSRLERGQAVAK